MASIKGNVKSSASAADSSDETWQLVEALDALAVDDPSAPVATHEPESSENTASETLRVVDAVNVTSVPETTTVAIPGAFEDIPETATSVPATIITIEAAPTPPPSPPDALIPTMSSAKLCNKCEEPAFHKIVGPENDKGNIGRPYYVCKNEDCTTYNPVYESGWVSWADSRGLNDSNPPCFCGTPSRQDRIGKDEGKKGRGYWTCAEGGCDYHSQDRYGQPGERNPFVPWLL